MGLLDDAIRDHLELKRSRGADPSEIAREEREALEPVFPDEPRPAGFDGEPQAATVLDEEPPHGDPLEDAAAAVEADGGAVAAEDPFAKQPLGEETAEIDMQAVLEEDVPELDDAATGRSAAAADDDAPGDGQALRPAPAGEEDLIEWEVPGSAEDVAPQPLPGQESMSFE